MLKKIVVIIALILLVGFSFSLITKPQQTETNQPAEVKTKLPETVFAFTKESLPADCLEKDEQLCAVENAVKCTINPALEKQQPESLQESEAEFLKFFFVFQVCNLSSKRRKVCHTE